MTLSETRQHQIFDDQRASGLWVLYHRAARDSGPVNDRRELMALRQSLYSVWLELLPASVVSKVKKQGEQRVRFGRIGEPTEDSTRIAKLLGQGLPHDRAVLLRTLVSGWCLMAMEVNSRLPRAGSSSWPNCLQERDSAEYGGRCSPASRAGVGAKPSGPHFLPG